jgi:hypothetical protein
MQFYIPVHRPAAAGPATVCVMAHALAPLALKLTVTQTTWLSGVRPESTQAMTNTAVPISPSRVMFCELSCGSAYESTVPAVRKLPPRPPRNRSTATAPILLLEKWRSAAVKRQPGDEYETQLRKNRPPQVAKPPQSDKLQKAGLSTNPTRPLE